MRVPSVGDKVKFEYKGQWLPATVTRVGIVFKNIENDEPINTTVDLDVECPGILHHQGQDTTMKITNAAYSENDSHVGMWHY